MRPLSIARIEPGERSKSCADVAISPFGVERRFYKEGQVVIFLAGKARLLEEQVHLAASLPVELGIFRLQQALRTRIFGAKHGVQKRCADKGGEAEYPPVL